MSLRPGLIALALWYGAVVLFLFAPLLAGVAYAFNTGVMGKQVADFTGFTWDWFGVAWHDASLRRAVETSLTSAFWAAVISVIVGTALGYAMVRHPSRRLRAVLAGLAYLLLIVPESVLGVSLLLFYAQTEVALGLFTLIAGITPVCIAVVALIVRARMLTLDRRSEEAAADLGASRLTTLRLIVLPQLLPALGASALMSYTFAFDNLVIAAFLTTPRVNTLSVYLYGSLHYGPSPAVFAAAAAVFTCTLALLAVAGTMLRGARRISRRPAFNPRAVP